MVRMNRVSSGQVPFRRASKRTSSRAISRDDLEKKVSFGELHVKPGARGPRRLEVPAPHQFTYKPCVTSGQGRHYSVAHCVGPDRETIVREEKRYMDRFRPSHAHYHDHAPAVAPPRRRHWRPLTWLSRPPRYDDKWRREEEAIHQERDYQQALSMGYETLVGNLVNLTIPNNRDLNRSWLNFLSDDEVEWGFPYNKGTMERPRCCQPRPYLAHQLREKLWKFPKTKVLTVQF